MKMFKKLMAVALAGVMALTVLTGCAGTVNEKDTIACLNDTKALAEYNVKTIEAGDSALAKEALSKVKTYAESHANKYETEVAYATDALVSLKWHGDNHDAAGIIKAIVPDKTEDAYYLAFAIVPEYKSKEMQNQRDYMTAQELEDHIVKLNGVTENLGDKAVASIASTKIGDETFVVVVFVQAKK